MKVIDPLFKIYSKSRFFRSFTNFLLNAGRYVIPEATVLKFRFKKMLGYSLNLDLPKTYNEKIQWLKLNDRSELHVTCADKFAVREHIEKKIGLNYLIPLINQTKKVEEINPETLPDYPVIIKTTHDSGGVLIVRDKHKIDWTDARKKLTSLLNYKYANIKSEWQYEKIEPRLVVEKLLISEDGKIPSDYKFHCFNGKVGFIQVDVDRETNHKKNLYDIDWNLIPCEFNYPIGPPVARPTTLGEMIEVAQILSKDFLFVRVDLYSVKNKVYFGELTFHPASGFGKFIPEVWDLNFGQMLKLPVRSK
ncbi:ATP-grasp fold amidoligase family protein [Zobellia sp. 1_MG-2023]|uniref:ATP-grasp fold amidoligase family protein n=1 Tax=Zobellia sp. 1_MG-2023 TaxID=3062626 RepID=UPI0026E3A9E0|nr:ATP-grasp fold amidoligase family protein [Zobellia sp. 1_MG-2023]MDO6819738.1 ATP-grasp fold amidoligase family protein [Zobellia sp. 1_MG-2023]